MSDQTFLLPDLGEGLTEAEVVKWLVAVGDDVAIDATIVEVETAKSLVEVPSPFAGRVSQLHAEEGSSVDVGKPLITIASGLLGALPEPTDEAAAEQYREEEKAGSGNVLIGYGTPEQTTTGRRRRPKAAPVQQTVVETELPEVAAASVLVISPIVRRLARANNVNLASLAGSGVGGLVTRRDVETAITGTDAPVRFAPGSPAANAGADPRTGLPVSLRTPMSGMRKAVSTTLSRSRSEIPEATVWVDVDATKLLELRASFRTPGDSGPGLLAILARFVVAGLRKYPELNGQLDVEREEIIQFDGINLGLAVQGGRGLAVPAVVGAHAMTIRGLDNEIRALTERARTGKATPFELTCGTFTLNNYGSFGVDGSAAIINHPQVAILGIGRIIDKPWVVDGEIAIRKMTQLSFVFDHRICDGGIAAGFLRFVADAIENPSTVLVEL